MWLMLQQDRPDDYVIGTGESHSVKEFVERAFAYAGLDWRAHVEVDARYFRPTEVEYLRADASKAKQQLGWQPKVSVEELTAIMVDADVEQVGLTPVGKGRKIVAEKFPGWHQEVLNPQAGSGESQDLLRGQR
jgi:GDPmannose 4,6-dehydratase